MKLFFLEMALDKKELQRKLQSRSPKIIEHLFYLLLDKNNPSAKHWKNEIYSFLNDIELLKGSNKVPKVSFIYDNTYGYRQDRITSPRYMKKFLLDVCQKENLSTNLSLEEIMTKLDSLCNQYFSWLATMLHDSEFVTQEEVFSILDKLID